MTCRQMGGPCDFAMQADTAEEMMKIGGDHVNEMAAKGDAPHQETKKMMDASTPDTDAGKAWMTKFNADFAAAPSM